jgi:hypothetical protein
VTKGVAWSPTRMRPGSLLPTVLLLVGPTVGVVASSEPPAAHATDAVLSSLTASMRDQHGRAEPVAAGPGRPQAVFVVSARRLRRLKDWQKELDRRVDGVGFLRVADVPPDPGQPPPRFEDVAETLRKRVPEDVPVLIDLERRFALRLDLDTREVNVLLFDASGGLVGRLRGRSTPEAVAEAATRLLALPGVRPRASSPPRPASP